MLLLLIAPQGAAALARAATSQSGSEGWKFTYMGAQGMVFEVPLTARLRAYVADTVAADSQGDGVCSREVGISVLFCHSKDIFPCVLLCISNSCHFCGTVVTLS